MNKPILVIGDGGHASVLIETLLTLKRDIVGYTAPTENKTLICVPYLGTDEVITSYNPSDVELVIGLGTINISLFRKHLFNSYREQGYVFASVIHPSAIVSPSVCLGEGTNNGRRYYTNKCKYF